MTSDLLYVLGVLLVVLAIPALATAYADRRPPLVSLIVMVLGFGLIGWIYSTDPTTYALPQLPNALFRVIGYVLHSAASA